MIEISFVINKEDLEKYIKQGFGYKDIAKIYNCSPMTISRKLKQFDLHTKGYRNSRKIVAQSDDNRQYNGQTYEKLRSVFRDLVKRCYDQNRDDYKYYGGKGITVCGEWLDDFINFYNWAIDNGYKEGLTIDRINVNGNYEPNNCRWVTMKVQANNRTNNHYLTINGETRTLIEWSEITNTSYDALRDRIYRDWDLERLFDPLSDLEASKQSIETGVTWNDNIERWVVRISKNGKRHYVGCTTSEEDAIKLKYEFLKQVERNDGV